MNKPGKKALIILGIAGLVGVGLLAKYVITPMWKKNAKNKQNDNHINYSYWNPIQETETIKTETQIGIFDFVNKNHYAYDDLVQFKHYYSFYEKESNQQRKSYFDYKPLGGKKVKLIKEGSYILGNKNSYNLVSSQNKLNWGYTGNLINRELYRFNEQQIKNIDYFNKRKAELFRSELLYTLKTKYNINPYTMSKISFDIPTKYGNKTSITVTKQDLLDSNRFYNRYLSELENCEWFEGKKTKIKKQYVKGFKELWNWNNISDFDLKLMGISNKTELEQIEQNSQITKFVPSPWILNTEKEKTYQYNEFYKSINLYTQDDLIIENNLNSNQISPIVFLMFLYHTKQKNIDININSNDTYTNQWVKFLYNLKFNTLKDIRKYLPYIYLQSYDLELPKLDNVRISWRKEVASVGKIAQNLLIDKGFKPNQALTLHSFSPTNQIDDWTSENSDGSKTLSNLQILEKYFATHLGDDIVAADDPSKRYRIKFKIKSKQNLIDICLYDKKTNKKVITLVSDQQIAWEIDASIANSFDEALFIKPSKYISYTENNHFGEYVDDIPELIKVPKKDPGNKATFLGEFLYHSLVTLSFITPSAFKENVILTINGVAIDVINSNFQTTLRDLRQSTSDKERIALKEADKNKPQNELNETNSHRKNEYLIEIKQYRDLSKQNPELLHTYTKKLVVDEFSNAQDYKWYAWNPQKIFEQRQLISPYLLDQKTGEPILDGNNQKIPNPKFDPLIDPSTGTKKEIVWIDTTNFTISQELLNSINSDFGAILELQKQIEAQKQRIYQITLELDNVKLFESYTKAISEYDSAFALKLQIKAPLHYKLADIWNKNTIDAKTVNYLVDLKNILFASREILQNNSTNKNFIEAYNNCINELNRLISVNNLINWKSKELGKSSLALANELKDLEKEVIKAEGDLKAKNPNNVTDPNSPFYSLFKPQEFNYYELPKNHSKFKLNTTNTNAANDLKVFYGTEQYNKIIKSNSTFNISKWYLEYILNTNLPPFALSMFRKTNDGISKGFMAEAIVVNKGVVKQVFGETSEYFFLPMPSAKNNGKWEWDKLKKLDNTLNPENYFSPAGTYLFFSRAKDNIHNFKIVKISEEESTNRSLFTEITKKENPEIDYISEFWKSTEADEFSNFLLTKYSIDDKVKKTIEYEALLNYWKEFISQEIISKITIKPFFDFSSEDNKWENPTLLENHWISNNIDIIQKYGRFANADKVKITNRSWNENTLTLNLEVNSPNSSWVLNSYVYKYSFVFTNFNSNNSNKYVINNPWNEQAISKFLKEYNLYRFKMLINTAKTPISRQKEVLNTFINPKWKSVLKDLNWELNENELTIEVTAKDSNKYLINNAKKALILSTKASLWDGINQDKLAININDCPFSKESDIINWIKKQIIDVVESTSILKLKYKIDFDFQLSDDAIKKIIANPFLNEPEAKINGYEFVLTSTEPNSSEFIPKGLIYNYLLDINKSLNLQELITDFKIDLNTKIDLKAFEVFPDSYIDFVKQIIENQINKLLLLENTKQTIIYGKELQTNDDSFALRNLLEELEIALESKDLDQLEIIINKPSNAKYVINLILNKNIQISWPKDISEWFNFLKSLMQKQTNLVLLLKPLNSKKITGQKEINILNSLGKEELDLENDLWFNIDDLHLQNVSKIEEFIKAFTKHINKTFTQNGVSSLKYGVDYSFWGPKETKENWVKETLTKLVGKEKKKYYAKITVYGISKKLKNNVSFIVVNEINKKLNLEDFDDKSKKSFNKKNLTWIIPVSVLSGLGLIIVIAALIIRIKNQKNR